MGLCACVLHTRTIIPTSRVQYNTQSVSMLLPHSETRSAFTHSETEIHNAGGGRAIWPCNADRTARGQNPKLCTTFQASTPDYLMKKRGTKDEKDRRKNEKEEKNWEERGKQVGTAGMKNKERPTASNQRCAVDDIIILFSSIFLADKFRVKKYSRPVLDRVTSH